MEMFSKIFDHTSPGLEAARALMGLQQGTRTLSDYAFEFQMLAANTGWSNYSLRVTFHHGLSDAIQDLLVTLDKPPHLDSLVFH